MVAPLGAGVAQTDEQFVGLQGRFVGVLERATVCHKAAGDNSAGDVLDYNLIVVQDCYPPRGDLPVAIQYFPAALTAVSER